jgi:UDP-N-acetylmuramoyl-L-alanyl-D-glutamate--2,6-diaminopimelate ligase
LPRLSDLLVPVLADDPDISGLTADSRQVRPGDLFAALPGVKSDGRAHIAEALAKGATAVLAPPGTGLGDGRAALITDANPRRRFAQAAARFYRHQPETMVAVTGTNGKTSVAGFVRQIWSGLGHRAASLGTLGLIAPHRSEKGSLTTPDSVWLQRNLAELAQAGVTHAAMEASSHGLDQCRLDGVILKAAAFTNLTRDHLDYHRDMNAYWQAKLRLFTDLLPPRRAAVANADSDRIADIEKACREHGHTLLTYGFAGRDLTLRRAIPVQHGQDIEIDVMGRGYRLTLPLVGIFQVQNVLCALGLVIATGADPEKAVATLTHLEGIPGRLQFVAQNAVGGDIYVDYAHTPDALATALTALRPHAARLVVVFGCGGDRDPGKRPVMGRIAAEIADTIIVTDDNPRSEDAATIRAQILKECPNAIEIADRRRAIEAGVGEIGPGDVLLVAGKGHETGQIVGGVTLPFDDSDEVRRVVGQSS